MPLISRHPNGSLRRARVLPSTLFAVTLLLVHSSVFAEPGQSEDELLDKGEYRTEIEEITVTARQPEWREQQKPEWRASQFELPEQTSSGRMEWLPEYTKDERDNYREVRDRNNEKAEFKLFEWKF